jgi:alpha-L-rhamnosidase
MQTNSKDGLWNTGFHFGDWLFYRPLDDNDGKSAVTDKYLIAQCFFAHSTQLLINAAIVLNKKEDEEKYKQLLKTVKDAFAKEYITGSGRLVSGTQTAYVLALNFNMLPESQRQQAADRLVTNIRDYNMHLTTGFLGTPYLCAVLTRFGYADIAYSLLMQKTFPSWLYPVTKGATTIWERWNGMRPDGSFEPASMNSFNHYAYGAIGDWMYTVVAGLDMDAAIPGYKSIVIKPYMGGGLTWASAVLQSGYGKIVSGWKMDNGKLVLDIEIPANTTATIYIPAKQASSVTEGGKMLAELKEITVAGEENGRVVVKAGSGKYHFEVNNN